MNWDNAIDEELKEVLETLQPAFEGLGINFFVIGAVARDIWYAGIGKTSRRTKDIDFAILAGDHKQYEAVKHYLREKKGYRDSRGNSFVMLTPGGTQVDILPFGGIENDGGVEIQGRGLTNIRVEGMLEVFESGTKLVTGSTGQAFQVASLPAIVLLKLVAYGDRPDKRLKDARDIASILQHFFELQTDLIYENHADLFVGQDMELEELAAIVVGREIRKILHGNTPLLERIQTMLASFQAEKEDDAFVRAMMAETNRPSSEVMGWLMRLSEGLAEQLEASAG